MTLELRKYHLIEAIMAINDEASIIKHEEFRKEIDNAEKGRLIDIEQLQNDMKN